MAITALPGWKVDPNNPNGVVQDTAPSYLPGIQYKPGTTELGGGGTAPAATTPTGTASPTIASIYGSGLTQSEKDIEGLTGGFRDTATAPVDEQAIRDRVTKQLQMETDAINRIYDEKLRVARIGGESALGSNAAISARRGLLGSDFGSAQNAKVLDNNAAVYGGIDAERQAAIGALTSKGMAAVRDEIAQKNTLKQQSTADYINFLGQQETRRASRVKDAATRALSSGIDLSTLAAGDLKAIADSYQISPDALMQEYTTSKKAQDAAKLVADRATADEKRKADEAAAKLVKDRYITLSDGVTLYDTQTNKVVSENVKNFAPKAPGTGGLPLGKGTPTGFTQADVKQGDAALKTGVNAQGVKFSNGTGADGKIDPAGYVTLFNHWIAGGGTKDAFFSYYPVSTYINPANTWVWDQLGIPNPKLTETYKGTVPTPKTKTGSRSI